MRVFISLQYFEKSLYSFSYNTLVSYIMRIGIDCRTYGPSGGYMGKYIESEMGTSYGNLSLRYSYEYEPYSQEHRKNNLLKMQVLVEIKKVLRQLSQIALIPNLLLLLKFSE